MTTHDVFNCLRQTRIESLNLTFEEYHHPATGARHIHLAADDDNNAFLVCFLTVPHDSTGIAHILEHTSLCGSRRYPVRDPFFMMIHRSLHTFMNALTSSDWTAYPFASRNVKDFDNLLNVYLDAAFFPNLHELDFAQEGHRLEFSTPNDPTSPLVYKGVVYNEMKGALSSPIEILWRTVQTHLFPTTTYHYDSGGEPREIPNLTHAQLKAFHATHYHPANAIFMTYGNLPAARHQVQFTENVLKHFQALDLNLHIPDEQRYAQPQQVVAYYPVDSKESVQDKTHILVAWLLGNSGDAREAMKANLLSRVLLGNSAAPLRHALETTPLATAPSLLCGFDDNAREAVFTCGVEGSNPEHASAIETLVLDVIADVVEKGIPHSQVESMLHQIELNQREINSGRSSYGLKLLMTALPALIYQGDPLDFLDIDPILTELRQECEDPAFIPNLARRLLLENSHRLRLVMAPDVQLAEQQDAEEENRLQTLAMTLSAQKKAAIIERSAALLARQQQKNDPDLLPKVGLADIPTDLKIPEGQMRPVADKAVTWFASGTNGLIYQAVVLDLPALTPDLMDVLPLFCECLTEVGCGNKDYQQVAAWQTAVSGGINAHISWRGTVDNTQRVRSLLSLSSKALSRNQAALTELMWETLTNARFDEFPRLRELIAQARADSDNSIIEQGHDLVMTACTSAISPAGVLSHKWYGFTGLQELRALDDQLTTDAAVGALAEKFSRLRDLFLTTSHQWVVVSTAEQHPNIASSLETYLAHHRVIQKDGFNSPPVNGTIRHAWCTHTEVNFCAKAYPVVPAMHPDAPALMILGSFLRNGYLHTAVREQGGAYGGGAHYDGNTGAFRFYSYRDPRLLETLRDFDNALDWLQNTTHAPYTLEEAILSVVRQIDRPGSPAGEALSSFYDTLHGRTATRRREFRKRVIDVTLADLQRVGQTYFQPAQAHIAVLSNRKTLQDLSSSLELEIFDV